MKVAVLGPKGTFSDIGAQEYLKSKKIDGDIIFFSTIDESVKALSDSSFDIALIPLENSLDGYVQRSLDILLEEEVYITEEIKLPIHFKLVSNCKFEEINKVYVQFKSQGQCINIINKINNPKVINTESNTSSYEMFLKDNEKACAIVPFHLETNDALNKIDNVEDMYENFTRFIILKKGKRIVSKVKGNELMCPMFICPSSDRSGILFEILKTFAELDLNLTSIISRPTKKKFGTYNFYLEVKTSSLNYDTMLEAIIKLKKNYDIKVLGIY